MFSTDRNDLNNYFSSILTITLYANDAWTAFFFIKYFTGYNRFSQRLLVCVKNVNDFNCEFEL